MDKAAFLDRDGTINKEFGYCRTPKDFELIYGVASGIARLNRAGYKVVVITNQSGISRGLLTEDVLADIHIRMCLELLKKGAKITSVYYCPHLPNEYCICRKPRTEMVERAIKDLNLDLQSSIVIGNSNCDKEMADNLSLPYFKGVNEWERSYLLVH